MYALLILEAGGWGGNFVEFAIRKKNLIAVENRCKYLYMVKDILMMFMRINAHKFTILFLFF